LVEALRTAEKAGFIEWDATGETALSFVANHIRRQFGVSTEVIARWLRAEKLWPPTGQHNSRRTTAMPKDESWMDERLQRCAKAYPLVTDAAVARLKSLLEGEAHERPLTQGELLATATQLMDDMVEPVDPVDGGENANRICQNGLVQRPSDFSKSRHSFKVGRCLRGKPITKRLKR